MSVSPIILTEVATPNTPAAGKSGLFVNTGSTFSTVEDAGVVRAYHNNKDPASFVAGTTSAAPITTPSGSLMTAPAAGSWEYDGNAFYLTPSASNRAVAAGIHFTSTSGDFTGTNVNTAQPVFDTTEDVITLPGSTSYLLEMSAHIHTTGTTSHTLGLLFAGSATLTSIGYQATVSNAATEVLGAMNSIWSAVATVTVVSAALASATHHSIWLSGIVRINGTGTFIPQYQWSAAPGVAGVTLKNSWLRLTPIGSDTVKAVGNWA